MALLERCVLIGDSAVFQIAIDEHPRLPEGAPESQPHCQIIHPRGIIRLHVGIGMKVHVTSPPLSRFRQGIEHPQRGLELKQEAVGGAEKVPFVLFPLRCGVGAKRDRGALIVFGLGLDNEDRGPLIAQYGILERLECPPIGFAGVYLIPLFTQFGHGDGRECK